jgi:hypothetical protein
LGALLGAAALTAAIQAQPVSDGVLQVLCRTVDLPQMVPTVADAEKAVTTAQAEWEQARHDTKITPFYFAQRYDGLLGWAKDYLIAAQKGGHPVQPFEIQVFCIGNVAFVAYPGEMFVDYQLSLDQQSPFARTFALGYSNGCIGYVPTASAYSEGGYEVDQAFKYYGTLMITSDCERLIKTATNDMLQTLFT